MGSVFPVGSGNGLECGCDTIAGTVDSNDAPSRMGRGVSFAIVVAIVVATIAEIVETAESGGQCEVVTVSYLEVSRIKANCVGSVGDCPDGVARQMAEFTQVVVTVPW